MKGFTEQEKEIMNKIVEVHNLYLKLKSTHPSDIHEWVKSIHDQQHLLGIRILRRELPFEFSTINKN